VTLKHIKIQIFRKVCALIIFVLLYTADPIIRMASVEIKELINACDFKTGTRTNRSRYIYKERDCGLITCKYSTSYVPPLA
jgi:hypothetical protein